MRATRCAIGLVLIAVGTSTGCGGSTAGLSGDELPEAGTLPDGSSGDGSVGDARVDGATDATTSDSGSASDSASASDSGSDSDSDSSSDSDSGSVSDSGSMTDGSADAPGACAAITGTTAFGVKLSGAVTFDDPGEPSRTVSALLFFPSGRVAGAPVVLARPRTMAPGWDLANGTLGADLGVASLAVTDPNCTDTFDGALLGPTDGVLTKVKVDVTAPSDAVLLKPGTAKLCAIGAVDAPTLTAPHTVGMRDPIELAVNLPVDPATIAGVKLSAGAVPITVAVDGDRVRLAPTGAYLPSATMPITLGGMADPLGRPFPAPAANVFAWTPSGALPEGTIGFTIDMLAGFGASFGVIDGELRLAPNTGAKRYGIALGLDSKTGTTKLRIRHRFACTTFAGTARAAILGSGGEATPFTVGCSATPVEEVVTLPGSGKRYLWIEATAPANPPCSFPSSPTLPDYALTTYGLEP